VGDCAGEGGASGARVSATAIEGGASGSMGAQAATEAMRMSRRLMRMAIAVESPVIAPS
jgi:hypothetical protein